MSQNIRTVSLADMSLREACDMFNQSYQHYIVPITFDLPMLTRRIQAEDIDLISSRLLQDDAGAPAGIMLIARRGRISRLAGLGIIPERRGAGMGSRAVALAIAEARARADTHMILEVIETNTVAISTYSRAGFVSRRRLVGYTHDPVQAEDGAVACSIDHALALLMSAYPSDPSWQFSPVCFAGTSASYDAFRTEDNSAAALVDGTGATARLLAFAVTPTERRKAVGRRFMKALLGRFPNKPWAISAAMPENQAAAFLTATG
ncbi:GNAT family N-acetyltransferase, partial [Phaeovulum sp.]|uniref:GNAT family N-acetyltransferase n=1 Tax=Phaeovulum sp. TaxID=2934796 RepID=UPI0035672E3F